MYKSQVGVPGGLHLGCSTAPEWRGRDILSSVALSRGRQRPDNCYGCGVPATEVRLSNRGLCADCSTARAADNVRAMTTAMADLTRKTPPPSQTG
jgi:hypothetical protein